MTTDGSPITVPRGVSAELVRGQSYTRPPVEHDVRNANAFEFVFVEIELKVHR